MAAITAKRLNKKLQIDIFDINNAIGKKILASGNGRCNISNTQISDKNYIGENPSFVNPALKEFNFNTFEKFCKSIGLLLDKKENSKVYPLSNEAKSVVSLLENCLKSLNVNLILEMKIINIKKIEEKFTLLSKDKEFKSYDKVLISSGLMAAPQLNATEDGLIFASNFEHSINPTYPSLVGLQTEFKYKEMLKGVKKETTVTLYINKQKEIEVTADLLFTNYGVSGFSVLDISQYAVYALTLYQNVEISINFFPQFSKNELLGMLETLFESLEESAVVTLLTGLIPKKLAKVLLEITNLSNDILAKDINSKHIRTLVNILTNFRLKVIDTQGFKHAEVSGGGIRTIDVDSKTYESKLCKNLYFAGEVLDIVGNRGGFNLHFAWASGYMAGKALCY